MRPITTSVTGVAAGAWIPLDWSTVGRGVGVYVDPGAGATVSVEITPDNVLDPAVTPIAYPCGIAALTGAVADAAGFLELPACAVRINQSVGATTSLLKLVTAGIV